MINPLTGGLEIPDYSRSGYSEEDIRLIDINKSFNPVPSTLDLKSRVELIKSVGEEIIMENEIEDLLKRKEMPICYDGFEPSGRMHIAQGVMRTLNVNKLIKAGCQFIFWVADWFAVLNNKMGGDLEKVRTVGRYFIEIWRAVGMDLRNVKFLWASDEINQHSNEYWTRVIDISRKNTLERITRCGQIMGRSDKEKLFASQILYPCMQCSDIFHLEADICQLGMDQRKVNMLAREYCDDIGKKDKPIIISHHMLSGLNNEKMSKSNPRFAIFMEDSAEEVAEKINEAFLELNNPDSPVFDYIKNIVWGSFGFFNLVNVKSKETRKYTDYSKLIEDYKNGVIHPADLKASTANHVNELLEPVRRHFKEDPYAAKLLELVKSYRVTK